MTKKYFLPTLVAEVADQTVVELACVQTVADSSHDDPAFSPPRPAQLVARTASTFSNNSVDPDSRS